MSGVLSARDVGGVTEAGNLFRVNNIIHGRKRYWKTERRRYPRHPSTEERERWKADNSSVDGSLQINSILISNTQVHVCKK